MAEGLELIPPCPTATDYANGLTVLLFSALFIILYFFTLGSASRSSMLSAVSSLVSEIFAQNAVGASYRLMIKFESLPFSSGTVDTFSALDPDGPSSILPRDK